MSDLKKKISELTLWTPTDVAVIPYVEWWVTKKALKSDLNGTDWVDWKTILNWSIDPTTEWVDGDFYINTTSWKIFWPKNTTWGTWVDLIWAIWNGIASIELLSWDHSPWTLDTYRVTYTDTTTFDYQVYNGADWTGDMSKSTYDPANWAKQVAFNDSVVHLTGNETISWDKTLTGNTSTQSLNITGTNWAWHLHLKHQATDPTATWSSTAFFADANWNIKYKNNWLSYVTLSTNANTANRVYTFPDKTWNVILDTSFGDVINSATAKTTPVDADMVGIMDSASSNVLKKLSWANIKSNLNTYFASAITTFTNKTITFSGNFITWTKSEFNVACTDWNFVYVWDALWTPSSWTLTNCTFPTLNQDTTWKSAKTDALNSATTVINVSSATAPTAGQVLTATDSTHATWQTPSASGWFWTAMPWTPTRASNTTFTVTWDVTAYVAKWMIVKWTESSTVRCAMVSIPSTYSNPNTTITIIGDTMASIDVSSLKYASVWLDIQDFNIAWTIWATGTDVARVYYAPFPMRVIWADLQVWTAWTTNNTTVDINKWGTTMFTTKPTLATTVASSPTPFTADTATSLALWDKVTIDIDAVQTTSAVDLYVQLYLFPTRYLSLT